MRDRFNRITGFYSSLLGHRPLQAYNTTVLQSEHIQKTTYTSWRLLEISYPAALNERYTYLAKFRATFLFLVQNISTHLYIDGLFQ